MALRLSVIIVSSIFSVALFAGDCEGEFSFVGPRLVLAPALPEDRAAIRNVLADTKTLRYFWGIYGPGTTQEVRETRQWLQRALIEPQSLDQSTVFLLAKNRVSGEAVGVFVMFPHAKSTVIAYLVSPQHRGHGYAPEMTNIMVEALSRIRPGLPVVAKVRRFNTASLRTLEKAGFAVIDEDENYFYFSTETSE